MSKCPHRVRQINPFIIDATLIRYAATKQDVYLGEKKGMFLDCSSLAENVLETKQK